MLDSRPKVWKFASFWVEMHKFCRFLSHFVFLWAKDLLRVEFHIFCSTIEIKARVFVSVSIGCSDEQLTQSRDYLAHTRSMSENKTYYA